MPLALNVKQCIAMRRAYLAGMSIPELATNWCVSYGTAQTVVKGTHPAIKPHPDISRGRGSSSGNQHTRKVGR